MKALVNASKFDFVGGGATNISKRGQLTGAHINLKHLFEAAEVGICCWMR